MIQLFTTTRMFNKIKQLGQLVCRFFSQSDFNLSGRLTLGGVPPYKSDEGARRKNSMKPLKGTWILFYGRVPNSFPPLRGTNSTTTNYITGTANFNSNKDNFRTLSSQGLFESIVINLTETTLAAVILGFSSLSGTSPQIETPKRYDEHPHHFYRGV